MPDGFGRMLESEASSKLKNFIFPKDKSCEECIHKVMCPYFSKPCSSFRRPNKEEMKEIKNENNKSVL